MLRLLKALKSLLARHSSQASCQIIGKAMVSAANETVTAACSHTQKAESTMTADIMECSQFSYVIAYYDGTFAQQIEAQIVARAAKLADMANKLPSAHENRLL